MLIIAILIGLPHRIDHSNGQTLLIIHVGKYLPCRIGRCQQIAQGIVAVMCDAIKGIFHADHIAVSIVTKLHAMLERIGYLHQFIAGIVGKQRGVLQRIAA